MSEPENILTYEGLTGEQRIYMVEFLLPEAVRSVMADNGITAYTQFVSPELQKQRPRCELWFTLGPGQGRFIQVNGVPRETAWKGRLHAICITESNNTIHSAYVVRVRSLLHGIADAVNNVLPVMENHKVQPFFRDGGTSSRMDTQDGYFLTELSFDLDFSVQEYAWDLINQQQ
jgi:hypothetical protein